VSQDLASLKLLRVLEGSYRPRGDEMLRLAEIAQLNKLYLAYLRVIRGALRGRLAREEAKYRWFVKNAVE